MPVMVNYFGNVEAMADTAGEAMSRVVQPSLYDRLDWFRLLDKHVPSTGKILIAHAHDDDAGQCWLPLMTHNGRGEGWASWYTLAFQPIWAGTSSIADQSALLAGIAASLRNQLWSLTLYPVPVDNGMADLVGRAFVDAGWHVEREDCGSNWIADTAGKDIARYWDERPSRLRNTWRRKARQTGFDIRITDHFDAAMWADYETVYAASWKPDEGAPAFVRALVEQEGQAGTLRLGLAYLHDRPVACQLWLVEDGTATIHKLSYAEDAKALSPGTVLSEAMFRHVIEHDRPERIDFGTGNDAYKADWMDRNLPLARMTMHHPRHIQGLIAIAKSGIRRLVRR